MKIQNFTLFFALLIFSIPTFASEPMIWTVDSRSEVVRGDAKGVSISETGSISLAPKVSEVYKTEQSYVWSSVVDSNGNSFLGTGNDGKIFKVDASGKGILFSDLAELDVSALAIAKDGTLFAGTSPDGKVYRLSSDGKAEVYFDSEDKYIWSLAAMSDGSLAIGTGENGKIYRVRAANAKPETSILFDSSDSHIICLTSDKQGNLYAGTDSKGLVLKFSPDGKPFALLDASLREIHDIAVGNDGSIYALALSDSASTAKPAATDATATPATEQPTPELPAKSRYDLTTTKSAVFRITADGKSEVIWNSPSVTGFSLLANQAGNGVLIGTSDKGRILNVTNDGRETLLLQTNEGQISTMRLNGNSILATSSNQGKLYRFGTETASEGTFESSVRDAKSTALWGRIWWRSSGAVSLQTRTGNTEKPDETWSNWSETFADQKGGQITNPKARFLQWRATLKNQGGNASLNEVNVSYLAANIAPEVLSIAVSPTNVGLAGNPPMMIDPNIETSGLDPQIFGLPPATPIPPRKLYQRGAKGLAWTAEDRNGDKLLFDLYFKEVGDSTFKLLRADLSDNFFTLDGLAVADGRYIFKVIAKDSPSNPLPQSLAGERITEAIDVDNTQPIITAIGSPQISGDKARVSFEGTDSSSFVKRAEYAIDGGNWQAVYADDGISDSGKERYSIEVLLPKAGEYSITLRVFDSQGNVGNARILIKK
jgi:sugar lactone lactonase YvrE